METRFKKMGGEYGGISKEQARFLFIQSIERTCPEVIEDLKDVFIHYGDLNWGLYEGIEIDSEYMISGTAHINLHWKTLLKSPNRKELKQALEKWGEKHNIAEPWIYEAALRAIEWRYYARITIKSNPELLERDGYLERYNESQQFKTWGFERYIGKENPLEPPMLLYKPFADKAQLKEMLDYKEFSISCSYAWNPFRISRSDFKNIVLEDFERKLNNYLNEIDLSVSKGQLKTSEIRNFERFEWLVLYQICCQSHNKIAKKYFASRETVRDRIKEAAEMCGIKLRPPGKPGRPKKK